MKARHAAALALVAWYLLQPPWSGPTLDLTRPLSKWVNQGSFGSAAQREIAKADLENGLRGDIDTAEGKSPNSQDLPILWGAEAAEQMSQYIASDDSRLKPK